MNKSDLSEGLWKINGLVTFGRIQVWKIWTGTWFQWRIFTDLAHFSVQVLEANSMMGGVELLELRPEQLSSQDVGEEQVPSSLSVHI